MGTLEHDRVGITVYTIPYRREVKVLVFVIFSFVDTVHTDAERYLKSDRNEIGDPVNKGDNSFWS